MTAFVLRFTPPKLKPPTHFRVRAIEVLIGLIQFSWGLILLGPDNILGRPQFAELARLANQHTWAVFALIAGGLRIFAILRNGAWRRSPYVRALMAVASFAFWLQVCLGFVHSGVPTLALAACPWFCVADIYSVGVAAFDAGAVRGRAAREGV